MFLSFADLAAGPSLDLEHADDSSRLDSDSLAALPSDLAAQLEEHITDSGRLDSVPDDLLVQIEEQRRETKVRTACLADVELLTSHRQS